MAEDDEDRGGSRLEETKRVARIAEIATLLAAQPRRWTRARLAARYELCERQIARDLEVLRHGLGYHIDRTRDGYVIQGAPIVPRLTLTMPEVLALALAAGLARDSGDVDTITLGAAIAKLEALVPPDMLSLLRRELARGRSNSTAARRSETLALLERAWLERRRVRMVYETGMRGGARSERVVEPYHLQRYGRFWILIAYDHLRQAVRDFKVDRIRAAVLLEEHYTIPDDFDVATYRGTAWGLLRGEAGAPVDVELLFTAQAGRWVQEEDRGVPLTVESRPDGSVLVRLRVGITDEMVRWILGYGPECRVLAPDTLRQRVRTMAEETVGLYRDEG